MKEGEFVTETDEMTDSTRTDVFVQFTIVYSQFNAHIIVYNHIPNVTALTLPLIITTDFLHPNRFTDWFSCASSTMSDGSFS